MKLAGLICYVCFHVSEISSGCGARRHLRGYCMESGRDHSNPEGESKEAEKVKEEAI
jgi:hypothetical protein